VNRVIPVDKPSGLTSHDVVARVRRATGVKRVGHAGSLDPSATGVLIVLVGRATRLAQFFVDCEKRYRGRIVLGTVTDTQDAEGTVLSERPVGDISESDIERVFRDFEGPIEQTPPMVSALKHQGTPLYVLARKGQVVDRPARTVTVKSLRMLGARLPEIEFEVTCTRGTYVRTLAHDIGAALGPGAHLGALTRTGVGPFELDEAVTLQTIERPGTDAAALGRSMFDALSFLPGLTVDEEELDTIATGGVLEISGERAPAPIESFIRVTFDGRKLAAIARLTATRELTVGAEALDEKGPRALRPVRVFVDPDRPEAGHAGA
jgi:tRNA pseudouridine55 synthase